MPDPETWTPYGLEAIRVRHLRRRRIGLAVGLALAAGLILAMTGTTTTTKTQILQNGQVVSDGNQISIDVPDQDKPKDGPVTVALSPGRVTLADTSQQAPASTVTRADVPSFSGAAALNWNYYLLVYGPWVLLGLAALALGKRGPRHEVNYGVYKGALPLEMISAHARDQVLTTREARTGLFGKRREDHLPEPVLRVPQEGDS